MKKVFVIVAAMICSSSMVSNAGVSNLNNEKNSISNNSSSSNLKTDVTKVAQEEITIEVQNTSKSQIFVKYEGSIKGSSFLGAGTVTRYKAKPGDKILDKKSGAVLVSVTASTKSNFRFKI